MGELLGQVSARLGSLDLCNITLFVQMCGCVDVWMCGCVDRRVLVEGGKRRWVL
jgi:hypothetical protein